MKYKFMPLLITVIVILTSMSECKSPFDYTVYAPVSAEINGVYYSNDTMNELYINWPVFTGKVFHLSSSLYSETDKADINLYLERDTIMLNERYHDVNIYFGRLHQVDIDGWIELTDIYKKENLQRMVGTFEFVVKNSVTGVLEYEVRNGSFDVPYAR